MKLSHETEIWGFFFENTLTSWQNLKAVAPTHSEDLWVQQDNRFREGRSSVVPLTLPKEGSEMMGAGDSQS